MVDGQILCWLLKICLLCVECTCVCLALLITVCVVTNLYSIRSPFIIFFSVSFCSVDFSSRATVTEYSDEGAILPLVQGKIIGRVEKISV